jgi:CRISPR/Cas system-associated exonuclease Cas4 (RecB family)
MEVLYEPSTWKWDRQVVLAAAIKAFTDTCTLQKQKYFASGEGFLSDSEVEEEYESRVELGTGMLKYYYEKVAPQFDAGWTPKKVEIEFIVPIQNPDTGEFLWCSCARCRRTLELAYMAQGQKIKWHLQQSTGEWELSVDGEDFVKWTGLPVTFAGRIDMLAEDENGNLYIVDWKTAARLARGDASGQDRDEFLDLDDQIGSYVMALRRKLNIDVRGFVYVELKKAFPQPPQKNLQIRQGRMFSVNKQQDVDYETYRATVAEEDTQAYEAGLYDEFLFYLKEEGPNFHGRYQITKLDEELEEIERNLFYEAEEMTNPKLRLYPAPGRFSCGTCAFRQPCLEKNRQGDHQYILDTLFDRRKEHYWVKEISTDKQGGE